MLEKKGKLINYTESLRRGTTLRCKGIWPYEEIVDFMVIEWLWSDDDKQTYALLVSSGFKAGLVFSILPKECVSDVGYGVSTEWLKANWADWGYFDCLIDDVYLLERGVPSSLEC